MENWKVVVHGSSGHVSKLVRDVPPEQRDPVVMGLPSLRTQTSPAGVNASWARASASAWAEGWAAGRQAPSYLLASSYEDADGKKMVAFFVVGDVREFVEALKKVVTVACVHGS